MTRQSFVAFIIIRLDIDGRRCALLRMNSKWNDWSFVGGHVEPGEEHDWSLTANREADEELAPLHHGDDFVVQRIPIEPLVWTAQSKSASGATTRYEARYFFLTFRRDPRTLLRELNTEDFVLVDESWLRMDRELGDVVGRVVQHLGGDLRGLPLSWKQSVGGDQLPVRLQGQRVAQSGPNLQMPDA